MGRNAPRRSAFPGDRYARPPRIAAHSLPKLSSSISNTKVAFRTDVNASDPERCEPYSKNNPISAWVYHRVTCPNGIETTPANITFKTRVREGGEEGQPIISISTSGYVCKP